MRGYQDETVQSGFYGQVRWRMTDALSVITGARASHLRVRSRSTQPSAAVPAWTAGARESGEVTPYAGIVVHLTPSITAYASYSDTFIPQTQRDVSGRVLDPREGRQIELGVKASFLDGRVQASAAAFRTRERNRSFADVSNPGYFLQIGEVEIKGWEAEVSGSPVPNLDLSLGYARLDTEYLTHATLAGTQFTLFEPRHSLKVYANYKFGSTPWSVGGGAQITSGVIGTGVAGLRKQGGYGTASAQLGYRFDAKTTLSLVVNNVFDRTYYARVGGLNSYNTYGEPRSVSATLRTTF